MKFWCNKYLNAFLILDFFLTRCIDCQCVLPLTNGTWISSSRGTWIIPENRTEIQNFKASLTASQTTQDLACISSSDNQYILGTKSAVEIFSGIFVFSYTCIEIRTTSHSPSKYEFYFVTQIAASTGEPFETDVNTACNGTVEVTASNSNIIVAEGVDPESLKETLPDVIRGDYIVTITDQNGRTGNQTTLTSCNDTSALFFIEEENATQTVSAVGFSESGILYNMKTFTSGGVTFIYTYNTDSSVDLTSTHRFTCWAVRQIFSKVYATVYPELCPDEQNATSVPSGGQIFVMDATVTCPASTGNSGLSDVILAVIIVVCVLVVVVVVIIVIVCIRKRKRKDQSQSNEKTEDSSCKPGMKGIKRPKSSNDLDSARLINERNKAKLAKKLAKKKETRTIAVQASIWTAPVKRTTTALSTEVKRSDSQSSIKFIPYIRKQVIIAKHPTDINIIPRSNTTLDHKVVHVKQPTVARAQTNLERSGTVPKSNPKYLIKKNKVSNPRQKIIRQISEISKHSSDHYANEFEKMFPFPNEGNPNEYHNTLDIPDETEGFKETEIKQSSKEAPEAPKDETKSEDKDQGAGLRFANLNHRERTKNSLRSRPSTTDGVLGVKLNNTSGSIRKTSSEGKKLKSVLKFSYNSPYAMSDSQKEYSVQKAAWIRHQLNKDLKSKKHIEDMRKLEGERAFDKWLSSKRKTIASLRTKFSKTSSRTRKTDSTIKDSSNQAGTEQNSSNIAKSVKDSSNTAETIKDAFDTAESIKYSSNTQESKNNSSNSKIYPKFKRS